MSLQWFIFSQYHQVNIELWETNEFSFKIHRVFFLISQFKFRFLLFQWLGGGLTLHDFN
jgi:hypothetical protein